MHFTREPKMNTYLILAVGALALVGETAAATWNKNCPKTTTLATFNAAIIPFFVGVNGTSEIKQRVSLLIRQIKKSKVDIFCLQEIFFSDVQREIVAAVKDEFPYAFSAQNLSMQPTESPPDMACTPEQLQIYQQCIVRKCSCFPGRQLVCIVSKCATEINSFGSVCRNCLLIHPSTTFFSCVIIPASQFETNYGLLMLSKRELKNTKMSPFNSDSQFRGYLEASVDGVGDLVCTHLTAILSNELYAGPPVISPFRYHGYEEQQYAEITTLFPLVVAKDMPILLGDFNHGPASPGNITWKAPFLYGLMNSRGFYSPYVLGDGRCTFCISNPTTKPSPINSLIDHIYIPTNMKERVTSSRRILDDIRTSQGTPLSDHYGVKVTLKNTKESCNSRQQKLYYCLLSPKLHFRDLITPIANLGRLCAVTTA